MEGNMPKALDATLALVRTSGASKGDLPGIMSWSDDEVFSRIGKSNDMSVMVGPM